MDFSCCLLYSAAAAAAAAAAVVVTVTETKLVDTSTTNFELALETN